jgi:hypothetical protein
MGVVEGGDFIVRPIRASHVTAGAKEAKAKIPRRYQESSAGETAFPPS